MHWLIRPFKPKTNIIIFTFLMYFFLAMTLWMAYMYFTYHSDTDLIVLLMFCIGGIVIGCIAVAYWSIINKIKKGE